jgi:Flp pilus assembly protein TadB
MSPPTYGISAVLALSGTATAIYGIVAGEYKPCSAGLVLLLGATVFAVLYLGTSRKRTAREQVNPNPPP